MGRGDISISLIMTLVITVVSITLLIGIFGTKLPGFGKELYCKTFFHIYSSTFIPSRIRVDQSYCKQEAVMGITKLSKQTNYITSFSNGRDSERLSNGFVFIRLETYSVVSAFVSFSMLNDTIHRVRIDVGDNGVDFWLDLNSSNSPNVTNLTGALNSFLAAMPVLEVPIRINVSLDNDVVVHDLSVEYEWYFVKEEILAHIIACWQLAELGKASKDILCSEIVIPHDLRWLTRGMIFNEENITDMLMEEELCDIFSNDDINSSCGDEDNLGWNLGDDLSNIFDISVEYKADERKVVVS